MIKVTENPALGKFVTAEKLFKPDSGKKIVVKVTVWDKFAQNITADFFENNSRTKIFARLNFYSQECCQKLDLPEWKLSCKTNKFDKKGFRVWKVFDNPNRRANKYIWDYGLTLDAMKEIAKKMYWKAIRMISPAEYGVEYSEEYRNHPKGYCGSDCGEGRFLTFAEAVEHVKKNIPKKKLPVWTDAFYKIGLSGIGRELYKYNFQTGEETFADNESFVEDFNSWHSTFGNKKIKINY